MTTTPPPLRPSADPPLKILVVDDNLVDRLAIQRTLAQSGMAIEVVEADDVPSARARLAEQRFDVVLCDHYLPGGDGLDVLDHRGDLNAFTPFIALTGHGDEMLAATVMKRGAVDYLPKAELAPARVQKCITDALRMRDLEARERGALGALAHYAGQLRAITQASVRVYSSPTLEQMVEVIADEALQIFNVSEVIVEAVDRASARVRAERRSDGALEAPRLSAPLEPGPAGAVGSICLVGPARGGFDDTDALLLEQYARVAGIGLENARLLRDARDASRAREDVMAVVSHDLRSPLGTIVMGARMLHSSISRRGPQAQDELVLVERVVRGCKRMQRLLEDLVDLTRIDAGTFHVEPRTTRVAEVFQETVDAVQAQAESLGVSLRVTPPDSSLTLLVDRERVLQALGNLVGNALKVTPRGGSITLSAEPGDGSMRLTVSDTGPGVAPDDLPHLFDRYWQGPQGSRGATGLGLFIVRTIAEAHGGRAEVQSEPGQGSRFSLVLPVSTR